MRILVVYASRAESTKGIAEFIGEKLRGNGIETDVKEAGPSVDPKGYSQEEYQEKCQEVFQHFYDNYFGDGQNTPSCILSLDHGPLPVWHFVQMADHLQQASRQGFDVWDRIERASSDQSRGQGPRSKGSGPRST